MDDIALDLTVGSQSIEAGKLHRLSEVEGRVVIGIEIRRKLWIHGMIEFGTYAGVALRVDQAIIKGIQRSVDLGINGRIKLRIDERTEPPADREIVHDESLQPPERACAAACRRPDEPHSGQGD